MNRFVAASQEHASGQRRVHTQPEPKGQKFPCGSRVQIADHLGMHMRHFPSGLQATVECVYAHCYGGDNVTSYSLIVDGQGGHAWYQENQLTAIREVIMLTPQQVAHLNDTLRCVMIEDAERDRQYLGGIVDQYIATMNTQEKIDALSSDAECCEELLGFDPQGIPDSQLADKAKQYLDLIRNDNLVDVILDSIASQLPKDEQREFSIILREVLDKIPQHDIQLEVALKHFTIEEFTALIDFYSSPIGRQARDKSAAFTIELNERFQTECNRILAENQHLFEG